MLAGYKKQAESKGQDYVALGRMSENGIRQFLSAESATPGAPSTKKNTLEKLLPDYVGEFLP